MGVDLLDVSFRIEREWGVEVSMDDWHALGTEGQGDIEVGAIYELVLGKLGIVDFGRREVRLNEALWWEVRTLLAEVCEVPEEAIELGTPMEALFPRDCRRQRWTQLRRRCGGRLQDLDYPPGVATAGFAVAVAMVFAEIFRPWQLGGPLWLRVVVGMLGLWMFAETYLKVMDLFATFRTRIPATMPTAKELCRAVLAANYGAICREANAGREDAAAAVWERLRGIMVDALGVDGEEVTFRSRLFRDLGAG